MKTHTYSLDILVHKIKIEIRFPCTINIAFKLGKQEVNTEKSFKLENGQAILEHTLNIKASLSYDILTKKYQERKGIVTIHVVSNSGKNVAGILDVDLAKVLNESTKGVEIDQGLERCPDKNARIKMRVSGKLLEETENSQQLSSNASFYSSTVRDREGSVESTHKRTSIMDSPTPPRPKFTSAEHYHLQVIHAHSQSGNSHGQRTSRVEAFEPRHVFESAAKLENSRRQEVDRSKTISQLRIDIVEKDRKITRLEIQKTSLQKQCDLLKIQITNQKSKYQSKVNKQSELAFENEKLNKKIAGLESALESYKVKPQLRRLESFSTKYSSEQLAYRSERLDELELEHRTLKSSKEETEKILRQTKKESRELHEKSQDLQNSLNTLNKRLQLKENFYKEELRKANQKIVQFQNTKIELSNQNFFLKSQFDQSERKLIYSIREKQKMLGEEKHRQSRKNIEIQNEFQGLSSELQFLNAKLIKLTSENQHLQSIIKDKIQEKSSLQAQVDRLNHILVESQNTYKQRHNNQVAILRKQLEEKNKYRQEQLQGLLQSKSIQIQNLNRMAIDKSQHVKVFNDRLNEMQRKIKQKQQKIIELSQSLETTSKRLEFTKKNEDRLGAEINELRLSYSKIRVEFERVEKERGELVEYSTQSKQHQNLLLFELKNMIKTTTEELQLEKNTTRILEEEKTELISLNRQLQQRSRALNLNLTKLTEKQVKQADELIKKREYIKQLQDQNEKVKIIISEQKQVIDQENIRYQTLQTKFEKLEDQSQQHSFLNQQIKRLQMVLKDKESQIKSKLENQTKLDVHIQKQQYQIQSLKDQLKSRFNQIQNQKHISESVRKQILFVKQQIDLVKKDNLVKFEEINRLHYEKNKLNNELKNSHERNQLNAQDFKRYKQKCLNSFQKFFNSMNQQSNTNYKSVSNLQLDDLINTAHIKLKSIKQLNEKEVTSKIESLRTQLSRVKTEAEDMEKTKDQSNIELYRQYQSTEENFKFYKESMRFKELEMEEELAKVTDKLTQYVEQLNITMTEKEDIAQKYHRQLIKTEELSVYLEQAQREIKQIIDEKNAVIEQLEVQKRNNAAYIKRLVEQGSIQLQKSQNKFTMQMSQLMKQVKEKKKEIDSLQSKMKIYLRQIQQKNQIIRVTQKQNQDLKREIQIINNESLNTVKKEKQLHQKVRSLQQSVILTQQRQSQSTIFSRFKEKQLEEMKHQFEKQRHQLMKKLSLAETELKNSEMNFDIKFNSLTQENIFLKQRVAKSSKYSDYEYRKKDQEIVALNKQLLVRRNQIATVSNQFNQYKRQAENGARIARDQLQKNIYTVQSLEKKLGNAVNQLKIMEDKCAALEFQKKKINEDLGKSRHITGGDFLSLKAQNQKLKTQVSNMNNKYALQIVELKKCKQGLLSQIQELIIRHRQKSRQTAQYYDKQIRQLTARNVSIQNDADQKVKRAYKQKFEDRAALEFEVQCLRQELSKYTQVRVQRNMKSRNQFIGEVSEVKMKLFLSQQPLRNVESWIPSLVNQIQQYQETIYTHEKQIKQLQGQLQSTSKIVQAHHLPIRGHRSSRKSSFFPQSVIKQTFKGTDGSFFVQRLQEILINVQIALRKMEELALELESVTQDKCILLTKARQVYGGMLQGKIDFCKNQLASILDYSKVEAGSFYVRVSKPN